MKTKQTTSSYVPNVIKLQTSQDLSRRLNTKNDPELQPLTSTLIGISCLSGNAQKLYHCGQVLSKFNLTFDQYHN